MPFDVPTVVITHHAPSPRSIHPRYEGSLINTCFVSNSEYLMDASRAALWIHGHTHDSFDYQVAGTRVICKPRGYARDGVNANINFIPNLLVELHPSNLFIYTCSRPRGVHSSRDQQC